MLTVLPLIVGMICAWLGRTRADENGLLLVIRTVTAPTNDNEAHAVDFSSCDELTIPLGSPSLKKPGFLDLVNK